MGEPHSTKMGQDAPLHTSYPHTAAQDKKKKEKERRFLTNAGRRIDGEVSLHRICGQ